MKRGAKEYITKENQKDHEDAKGKLTGERENQDK
jgi:hypothetical protein